MKHIEYSCPPYHTGYIVTQYELGYKKGFSAGKNHKKKVELNGVEADYFLGYQVGYKEGRAQSKVAKSVTVVDSMTGKHTVISPMKETVKVVKRSLMMIAPSQAWVNDFEVKGSIVQMIRAEEEAKSLKI